MKTIREFYVIGTDQKLYIFQILRKHTTVLIIFDIYVGYLGGSLFYKVNVSVK